MRRFLPNAPHFHGKRHLNPWIAGLYRTAHCGATIKVCGRKAVHWLPCFKVPLWCDCCILFDAYRIQSYWVYRAIAYTELLGLQWDWLGPCRCQSWECSCSHSLNMAVLCSALSNIDNHHMCTLLERIQSIFLLPYQMDNNWCHTHRLAQRTDRQSTVVEEIRYY